MSGTVEREGPLGWGQHMYWEAAFSCSEAAGWGGVVLMDFEVPSGVSVRDLVDAATTLVARHEALRTSYDAERPAQRVHRPSPVHIELLEASDMESVADTVAATRLRLTEHRFRLDREPPFKAMAVVVNDAPAKLVIATHHIAVDGVSMEILRDDFALLLPSRSEGRPELPSVLSQPLDLASDQESERGRTDSQEALRHWDHRLPYLPGRLFPGEHPASGKTAAFEVVLESRSLALASSSLGRRQGGPGSAMLTAFGITLLMSTGRTRCSFMIISANRLTPDTSRMVGALVQPVPITLRLNGDPTFSDVAAQTRAEAWSAFRNGRYDFRALEQLKQRHNEFRGIDPVMPPLFNLHDYGYRGTAGSGSSRHHPQMDGGVPRTRPNPAFEQVRTMFMFDVYPGPDTVTLVLSCGANVCAEDAKEFVRAFENVLVTAADRPDLPISQVATSCAVRRPEADHGWALVDNSWVETHAVADLLCTHPDLQQAAAFVVAAPSSGEERLEAYVYGALAPPSPTELHRFVLDALDGHERSTVIAPAHYVSCRRAPSGPADLHAWRDQEIVMEGSGRA